MYGYRRHPLTTGLWVLCLACLLMVVIAAFSGAGRYHVSDEGNAPEQPGRYQ